MPSFLLANLFFGGMLYLLLDTSFLDWDIGYQQENKVIIQVRNGEEIEDFHRCNVFFLG